MQGNWRASTADITLEATGAVCARVQRQSRLQSMSALFFDQNTYTVTVAPGVDHAAVAAMCIAFDEWEKQEGLLAS